MRVCNAEHELHRRPKQSKKSVWRTATYPKHTGEDHVAHTALDALSVPGSEVEVAECGTTVCVRAALSCCLFDIHLHFDPNLGKRPTAV